MLDNPDQVSLKTNLNHEAGTGRYLPTICSGKMLYTDLHEKSMAMALPGFADKSHLVQEWQLGGGEETGGQRGPRGRRLHRHLEGRQGTGRQDIFNYVEHCLSEREGWGRIPPSAGAGALIYLKEGG